MKKIVMLVVLSMMLMGCESTLEKKVCSYCNGNIAWSYQGNSNYTLQWEHEGDKAFHPWCFKFKNELNNKKDKN